MKNIVVLISGNGSNLQAVIDACENQSIDGKISAVFSNKADAYGLERATQSGIDAHSVNPKEFESRELFDLALMAEIDKYQPDLIILAGYMRILSEEFVRHYMGRMINIHPSLLPSFPGLEAWKQALEYGVKYTGCTVHFVDQGIDTGAIILQETVPVMDDDTPQSLHARIQDAEHHLYPAAVGLAVEGRLEVRGRLCSRAAI